MQVKALGTVIEWSGKRATSADFYSGMLDYWDHWQSIDPRLAEHHAVLSLAADAFDCAHVLVPPPAHCDTGLALLRAGR